MFPIRGLMIGRSTSKHMQRFITNHAKGESFMLENVEPGTIVSAEEIGEEGHQRYMAVVCRDPSGEKGCGEKRWARYYGPHRHSPTTRLCRRCNTTQAARNFRFGRALAYPARKDVD